MKAAVINKWGPPSVFEIKNGYPVPIPTENQLLIRVFASSVNPVEWKHRAGKHRFVLGSPFPIVLGYDICGEVVKTGKNIKHFKTGDIVFGDLDRKYGGGLAEYAIGSENCFALKPLNISSEEAAALPLAALTALQGLRDKAGIKAGQTVIINGASGGVGHLAVQIARIFGTKVVAVSGSHSSSFVKSLGPDIFLDYNTENIVDSGIKADIFFDVAGNLSFVKCLQVLNRGGVYVTTLPRPKILFHKLMQPFTDGKKVKTLLRKHSFTDMQLLANWVSEGKLKPHIDRTFGLDEIAEAHQYAELGHTIGKNIIRISTPTN